MFYGATFQNSHPVYHGYPCDVPFRSVRISIFHRFFTQVIAQMSITKSLLACIWMCIRINTRSIDIYKDKLL